MDVIDDFERIGVVVDDADNDDVKLVAGSAAVMVLVLATNTVVACFGTSYGSSNLQNNLCSCDFFGGKGGGREDGTDVISEFLVLSKLWTDLLSDGDSYEIPWIEWPDDDDDDWNISETCEFLLSTDVPEVVVTGVLNESMRTDGGDGLWREKKALNQEEIFIYKIIHY